MKSTRFPIIAAAGLMLVGCGSSSPQQQTGANRTRPEVMDLNDSPPRSIPPAQRVEPLPAEPLVTETPTAAAAAPRKHVVAAKDTLYNIAKTYYGDSKRWPEIVKANPGLKPERMPVGKTIIIP